MLFSIETQLFQLLTRAQLKERMQLSGGIYLGNDRPDDSSLEDIVIQCLECSFSKNTQGKEVITSTAEVLIYVPDQRVFMELRGQQWVSPRRRLKDLTQAVEVALRASYLSSPHFSINKQILTPLPQIHQHLCKLIVKS